MILIWLGSFTLMLFGLLESQKMISFLTREMQKNIFTKGLERSFSQMLLGNLGLVFFEASPVKSLHTGMALTNLQILGRRASYLLMCLSSLGAWWVLFLSLLYLNLNSFFLLGLAGLIFFYHGSSLLWKNLMRVLLMAGLFLLGGELTFRNSSVLITSLGQSDLAFLLADGRFLAMSLLMTFSFLLTLIVRLEFWSVALALCLLTSSTISINGALGLLVGERVAQWALFWWRTRGLTRECERAGTFLTLSSLAGLMVGFLIVGVVRDGVLIQDKSLFLILMLVTLLLFQFVGQMIWGHFASQKTFHDPTEVKYLRSSWIDQGLLMSGGQAWAKEKVQGRLGEIRYHIAGLKSLPEGSVPAPLKARLLDEEKQLSQLTGW